MPSSQTTDRIMDFVRKTFCPRQDPASLGPSSALFSNGRIDSLGLVELLAFIQQEFGVSLDSSVGELKKLDTAANLAAHIDQLKEGQKLPQ